MSDETIRLSVSLRLSVDSVHVTYTKDQQIVAFNFIFDLLWTGGGSSVSSVALLVFSELQ